MKLKCKEAKLLIPKYVDGTIRNKDLSGLLVHIRGCRSCYEELESSYLIRFALDFLDRGESGEIELDKLLDADLKRSERRIRNHTARLTLGLIFVLLLAAVALIWFLDVSLPVHTDRIATSIHNVVSSFIGG